MFIFGVAVSAFGDDDEDSGYLSFICGATSFAAASAAPSVANLRFNGELGAEKEILSQYDDSVVDEVDLSVPRRAAEDYVPPLDYKRQRPSQKHVAKYLHRIEWKLQHSYIGYVRS
ncbi:Auxin response factor 4 [Olea europaea subsp. europaea]|uniref:Auxin response factor 4 n=1 Tax=Olea europaea subsp. europaea TaxID=158383 RepID=A0A8S0TCI5_OLEEU|nr:Auxin response factor 4 [Olea europaea subsp. europaea]